MSVKCTECDRGAVQVNMGGTTCTDHTPFSEYEKRVTSAERMRKESTRRDDVSQCFTCSEKNIDKWGCYNRLYYSLDKLNDRPAGTNTRCVRLDSRKDFLCYYCIPEGKRHVYYPAMPFFTDFYWYAKDWDTEEDRQYWESKKA